MGTGNAAKYCNLSLPNLPKQPNLKEKTSFFWHSGRRGKTFATISTTSLCDGRGELARMGVVLKAVSQNGFSRTRNRLASRE